MKLLYNIALTLVIVGALNWLLIGLFDFDLVAAIFGDMTVMSRILYSLVGISAIVTALTMNHCERIVEKECDEYGRCSF